MSSGSDQIGAGLAREIHTHLTTARRALAELEADPLPHPIAHRVRLASNRVERSLRLLADGRPVWLSGLTIHDGTHFYLSTYCQHALVLETRRGADTVSEALHHACRQTCKICQAPCRCASVGCPCPTTRNRSNVVPENPDPDEGDPMGNKPGDLHPKRFGRSAQEIAAEEQTRRSEENARRETEAEKIEADDIARHPGEPGYE